MPTKKQLIESGVNKIVRRILMEGDSWIDRTQYNRARKGIELISNSLFDLQNISAGDPNTAQKKAKYDEFRTHLIAIRELLDEIV